MVPCDHDDPDAASLRRSDALRRRGPDGVGQAEQAQEGQPSMRDSSRSCRSEAAAPPPRAPGSPDGRAGRSPARAPAPTASSNGTASSSRTTFGSGEHDLRGALDAQQLARAGPAEHGVVAASRFERKLVDPFPASAGPPRASMPASRPLMIGPVGRVGSPGRAARRGWRAARRDDVSSGDSSRRARSTRRPTPWRSRCRPS